ncbi:MAG TPA: hypothetical protein VK502_00255 [Candidatus Saccharimonadales bacterium]|nr:hypothetical protein [Candidatus Saccharimonadales bacterium]
MNGTKLIDSEKTIKELQKLVVKVDYSESLTTKKAKVDSSKLWELAKKVGKNLNDDSLSSTSPARP